MRMDQLIVRNEQRNGTSSYFKPTKSINLNQTETRHGYRACEILAGLLLCNHSEFTIPL